MADEKEVARLLGIAQGHATVALSKPEIQRVSFLAHCRLNWKRYAAGFTKSAAEQERFAEILDRVTRDLMTIAEDSADDPRSRGSLQSPPKFIWPDSVEGAMDSVLVHEAAYEPPAAVPEAAQEDAASDAPENAPAGGRGEDQTIGASSRDGDDPQAPGREPPFDPKAGDPKATDSGAEEDRPRYGFAALEIAAERRHGLVKGDMPGKGEPLENAGDLQRKVQAVLRAHRDAKLKDSGS
jgi:hypothetical protein